MNVSLSEKYMLTLNEAAAYFNIGEKKLRRLAEDHPGRFSITNGNRLLIVRHKFEVFLDQCSQV